MKFVLFFLGCLLTASFFVSCNQDDNPAEEAETATQDEEWEPDMYVASELVLVMRKMYDDNLELKKRIKEGHIPEQMPKEYNQILTAEATNPDELNDLYYAMAKIYLNDYDAMTKADEGTVLDKYNNLIQTCVSCHQNYCQGPIPKIEKLYIK